MLGFKNGLLHQIKHLHMVTYIDEQNKMTKWF